MRVKSRSVWNLGSAWLWPSAMLRMSSSSRGRCSSAGLRRRQWKASTQVMPERSSCIPLRIVSRHQPRCASAQRCPPRPMACDGLGHEEPPLAALEGLGGVDEDGDHLGVGSHLRSSWASWCEAQDTEEVFSFQAPCCAWTTFAHPFTASLAEPEQRRHAVEYITGLLSKLEHKTGEGIAYLHDQERQGLQKFIGHVPWDHRPLLATLAARSATSWASPTA